MDEPSKDLVTERYPKEDNESLRKSWEALPPEDRWKDAVYVQEDDGTMADSVDALGKAVIGHKIVEVRKGRFKAPGSYQPKDGLAFGLNVRVFEPNQEGLTEAFMELEK